MARAVAVRPASRARVTLRLPPLRPYQVRFILHPARDLVVVSATQIGKSFACACWLLGKAWEKPNSRNWWAAPTYYQAEVGYRLVRDLARSAGVLHSALDGKLRLTLINGAVIEARSWERDENLQGPTVDAIVVDEAGLLTQAARAILSTRRSATLGPMRFIGNPTYSMSEFWRLARQAQTSKDTAVLAYMRWTWEDMAEALPAQEAADYREFIAQEKTQLPTDEFRRLYEAEFLEMGTGILDLRPVCTLGGDDLHPVKMPYLDAWNPERDGPCVGGMDLGEHVNPSVLTVWGRKSGRLLYLMSMKNLKWEVQAARAVTALRSFSVLKGERAPGAEKDAERQQSVLVYFDATGVGSAVAQVLSKASVNTAVRFSGVTFNTENKKDMVQSLQVAVEQRRIAMPWIAEAISEADTLERTQLATSVRYKAAEGFSDDIVWSMGLAIFGLTNLITGVPS